MCAVAVQVLKTVSEAGLFAGLDTGTCQRVAGLAEIRQFSSGDVICRDGEPGTGLHLVADGQVKLLLQGGNGHEKVFDLIGPGECFGEPSVFTGRPHQVTAQAIVNSMLLHVPGDDLLAIISETPELALRVIKGLAQRIYRRTYDLKSYMLMSGTQRVICYLLHAVSFDPEPTEEVAVTLPVRKGLIASRLNLTQEHFSRILHDLVSSALIRVEGQRVYIPDVRQLRALAVS